MLLQTLLCYAMYRVMRYQDIEPSDVDLEKWEAQLRKGSLALAVLATLWDKELYGLEILRRLDQTAGFSVAEGTIYPLLNRLKAASFVEADWVEADAGHPRKYFNLTASGRRYVVALLGLWNEFAGGMNRLLAPLEGRAHARRRAS
jgi:PadR family transcriptional regulator, regulatory protein PadR